MKRNITVFAVMSIVTLFVASNLFVTNSQTTNVLNEGFEAGGKTSYAAANVTLGSGSWYLNDALIGNLSTDRKTGSYAARIQNTGSVRMNFNVASAGTVSIKHARFSSDANSTWELWRSTNSGSTFAKVGSTITTSSTTLSTASFTINNVGTNRFEIRKVSGGTNRLNIDDIVITNYVAPTPTPTPTPTATPTPNPTPQPGANVHLTMGNPSNAVTDVNTPTNYLMIKDQYDLSYNRDYAIPNWTSWHLDPTWLGSTPRQDNFRADTTLPAGWYQVGSTFYSGSGYDRGHMTPSGDRTSSVANNSATFLMTNMIPQAPTNNQVTWAGLESYCRTLANSGSELYIISGGQGISGYINNGNIVVPTTTWKVIMVLPSGTNDVSRVTGSTRLIAVSIPNNNSVVSDWKQYRTSVDSVESLTGFNFFSNVPASIQNSIESTIDTQAFLDDFGSFGLDKYAQEEVEAEQKANPISKKE
jgi:endonuclease G, mitochondrial